MPGEIQMTARLYATSNGAYLPSVTYTKTVNMSGTDLGSQTQVIGTTVEALDVPVDVTAPYKLLVSNLDATNFVDLGFVRWQGFVRAAAPLDGHCPGQPGVVV